MSNLKIEKDPLGKDPHAPGAKLDAGKNRMAMVLGSFARALEQVSEVGTFGANKYTDGGWLEVPNGISRYQDAAFRHWKERMKGEEYDTGPGGTGLLHLAQEAWNILAVLDLTLRELERKGAPTKKAVEK